MRLLREFDRRSLVLIGGFLAMWMASPAAAGLGDANGDGSVTSDDADVIADFAFGIVGSVPSPGNADVNRDGIIDMRDALAIGQSGIRPVVLYTFPSSSGKVFNDSTVTIKGTVLLDSSLTLTGFTVNGSAVTLTDGSFEHPVTLNPGDNTITAVATEMSGTSTTREIDVVYLVTDSLSDMRARPGESVTVGGGGFDPTPGNMFVFFYPGVEGTITAQTETSITVTVPNNIGTATPGVDGITVVRKTPLGELVSTKEPIGFLPQRHEQVWNINTVDPDTTKTEPECTAAGGNFIGGFCIRHVAVHAEFDATGPLVGTATETAPTNITTTPDPIAPMGGTADIDIDTGWFYFESYYADDPLVPGVFPLLIGVSSADFTRVEVTSSGYDVINLLDNRNPPPLIFLQHPLDGQQTQEDEIEVYGGVNDNSVTIENVTLGLSFEAGTLITFFSQDVPLAVGDNLIRVTATDVEMRTDQREVTVTRIPLVTVTFEIKDPEPDVGTGSDPDPAKRNATGLNLQTLVVTLNGNPVDANDLMFLDNDLGGIEFSPDDLSAIRYDVDVVFEPGINDLNNGSNTVTATLRDNIGNEVMPPVEETFDASF